MSQNNDDRYQEIMKRIANRKPFEMNQKQKKNSSVYDKIADSLNLLDTLAKLSNKQYENIICHGPKALNYSNWSGVVLWYRPKGYYGYKTLTLLGAWVKQGEKDIKFVLGLRNLDYQAAVYNPEGYFASIRKGFKLFYKDNGHPPTKDDTILYQCTYEAKERLTIRQTLTKYLDQWQQNIEAD